MKIEIGCQGWNYKDWTTRSGGETVFYPHGTRDAEMLKSYAEAFKTVEVDSTFYAVPQISTVENWHQRTPADFTFSLKLPKEVTHERVLRESGFGVLDEFCERVLVLREKLAAVLIQLPPQFDASSENVRALLEFLPRLPKEIKFAVEFRSRDWLGGETLDVLGKHNVALCLTEGSWILRAATFEAARRQTADFAYVRFMGERDLTRFDAVQRPADANLEIWSELLAEISIATPQTFVYFSNFYEGFAPESANKLKELLGQKIVRFETLEDQPSLF